MGINKVIAAVAAVSFVLEPLPVAAQSGRTTILVGAGDATTGAFLPGVQIRISSLKLSQMTDSMGRARLVGVRDGTYTIEAKRVGYATLTAPVLVQREDSLEVVLLLRSTAMQLDTMLVSRSEVMAHLRDFEQRRARGVGQFVSGAQIDSVQGSPLKVILEAKIRGVTATSENGTGLHVMAGRPSANDPLHPGSGGVDPCWPVIYLDGVQLTDDAGRGPNIGFINPLSIGGIEFYDPAEAPSEYRASGALRNHQELGTSTIGGRGGSLPAAGGVSSAACGVMLIWSRG